MMVGVWGGMGAGGYGENVKGGNNGGGKGGNSGTITATSSISSANSSRGEDEKDV